MPRRKKPYVDAKTLSLDEWLVLCLQHPRDRPCRVQDYAFPTDAHRAEYLRTIHERSEENIKSLLRQLLMLGGSLGLDKYTFTFWLEDPGRLEHVLDRFEFARRLLNHERHTWEGNTWVIDLLPWYPERAIHVIQAYLIAHGQFFPDGRYDGHLEAISVIRARYLDRQNTRDSLFSLSPREFEYLVAATYYELGYDVRLTPTARDGGRDVEFRKMQNGRQERGVVEVKRQSETVGVGVARALLGVVAAEKYNRGVIVTSSEFSQPARQFADANPQLELVGFAKLNGMLNEAFGPFWPVELDRCLWKVRRADEGKPVSWVSHGRIEEGT